MTEEELDLISRYGVCGDCGAPGIQCDDDDRAPLVCSIDSRHRPV